ncbi:MOSC domain-containing protein [Photobacterium minamisatsumaniensis]|uniref:MOSC domain-containing protein n=1 Tax=Photobacterium minamisatsumaniensis TaxID=2910233 RepID=UPI003D0F1FE5
MLPSSTVTEIRVGKVKPMFEEAFGGSLKTGIDKQPLDHVSVNVLGMNGDQQEESFHGGADRALLQYDSAHYTQLKTMFPQSAAHFVAGGFGENIVATGINEHTVCIGDIVKIGTVMAQVSQTRSPCFKLNARFELPGMAEYVQNYAMTGWFYRVLEAGEIHVGDSIEVVERPYPQWSIAKVMACLYHDTENKQAATELAQLPELGKEITQIFARRLATGKIENWAGRLTGKKSN